jgi:hypothetical protein
MAALHEGTDSRIKMPMQCSRHPARDLAPAQRLKRAIRNIDKRLEEIRRSNQPIPMSTYRARRILVDALARCETSGADERSALFTSATVRTDAEFRTRRSYRGLVERYEALPGLSLPASPDFTGCVATRSSEVMKILTDVAVGDQCRQFLSQHGRGRIADDQMEWHRERCRYCRPPLHSGFHRWKRCRPP